MQSKELQGDFTDSSASARQSKSSSSTGILVNLISTDVKTLMDARPVLMIISGVPIGRLTAIVGLYRVIGWPCFVGFAITALGSPVTTWIAHRVGIEQDGLKDAQDSRISAASEYLRSIRIIKYFGWEDTIGLLNGARVKEQKHMWAIHMLSTASMSVVYGVPTIALLVIFGLHVCVRKHTLTASTAYTTISLLGIIRDNFTVMASLSMIIPKLAIACRRLDKFFSSTRPLDVYPEGPLRIQGATFRRDASNNFCLREITIDFIQGGLNVVVGASGSGKTTLLLAFLGETVRDQGYVSRPTDVAYASQTPWLQGLSVRENILFNSSYKPDRYQRIIEMCCLGPDLEELPNGDATNVGENGSDLSGKITSLLRSALIAVLICDRAL